MKKILNQILASTCVLLCSVVFWGCDITKCNHIASEEWSMNNTHHWHECTECGENMQEEAHDWDENVLIEAGQGEDGVIHYECNICGMEKNEPYSTTTVTESAWNAALALSNFDKVKMIYQEIDVAGTSVATRIKDGDILLVTITEEGGETNEYYSKEGSRYYLYSKDGADWIKEEISQSDYEFELAELDCGLPYSEFVYNEELAAYESDMEDISSQVYFKNDRLVKMAASFDDGDEEVYTIEYDNIELELPEAVLVTVTEAEWNNAMNLQSVDNYKGYSKGELPDGTVVANGTITKNGDIVYLEWGLTNKEYYSKEGDKYYYYQDMSGTWTKTEITQEEYEDDCGKSLAEDLIFSNFTYNKELKAYEANIEGTFYQIYFENGRLVKIVGSDEEIVQTMTFEYVEIELELPEEYSTTIINSDIYNRAMALYNYNKVKVSLGEDDTIVKDGYKMHYDIDIDLWGYYDYDEQTGKYYRYRNTGGTEVWVKTEITSGEYYEAYYGFDLSTGTIGLSSMGVVYEALTYNSELSAYECIIDGEANKVIMYFDCGKLVRFDVIMGQESAVCTIEYDNIELELPIVG